MCRRAIEDVFAGRGEADLQVMREGGAPNFRVRWRPCKLLEAGQHTGTFSPAAVLSHNGVVSPINEALTILRKRGHSVQTNPGACVVGGSIHVPIDGRLRSGGEILAMVTPEDRDVWRFEADGKSYQVHIYFPCGGNDFEIYEDGKRLGQRQPVPDDEDGQSWAEQIAEDMGGRSSLRRTFSGF
jgi:hypothetical protein